MTNAQRGSRVVFVGNIPYDMSEEQLVEVFSEVGKVVGFRLVNDRDTGKFKGYGFCEFEDPETAASAVRNLNEVDPGGAPQWGNRAGRDNGYGDRMQDGGFGGGGPGGFGQQGAPPAGPGGAVLPPNLPTGVPLPPGVGATDAITQTLATLPPNQLLDIMGQMKALTATSPDQARALLTGHPQLAYALFQAMLMMNVVDPAILQRILAGGLGALAGQNLGEEQRQLLMQVLQLTPDQINALPPDQKASIMQLKAQFGQA
ncbi:uncharacterized protein PFL1_01977 [Pseudozyma flocculosa PF-1]|uniref:uncharacterized protein n=1 Tax=Pseudozyma flocculosa PF-1 TaxID=1277687 RepID=UPI00045612ED|nr:uncharacterized protein PFL1_01977 [Pseudozyma flocculosa PF-1]EPQ30451.1 hypothetical protein PFL1_01977 [Pseudozyma flocculosa PF-1]